MVSMALPMMIGMSAHMLLNIIDGIYVSRLGLQEGLAVLNYGFPFFYLIFAVFNGVTSGSTSVLARFLGAKENAKAETAMAQIVWVCLGLFAVFLAIYPFALPAYLELQKASPESAALTRQYLDRMLVGIPFLILALLWGSGLRAEGNTRTLMTGMMAGTLVNIALAPFLIFSEFRFAGIQWPGLGWGVAGAGWAATGSHILTAAVVLSIYLRKGTQLRIRLRPAWDDRSGLSGAFAVGLPSIVSQALIGVNIFILTALATPFGAHAAAAIGIGARLETLAVFPALSIMIAVLSLVGQNFGARRFDRVEQSVRIGLVTACATLAVVGLAAHFLRDGLIGLFRPEAAAETSARHYVGITTLGYAFVGISVVSSGAFQGLGRGLPFLLLNLMRMAVLAAPLGWLLARTRGEYGLHYAPILASGATALVAVAWILAAVSRLRRRAGVAAHREAAEAAGGSGEGAVEPAPEPPQGSRLAG